MRQKFRVMRVGVLALALLLFHVAGLQAESELNRAGLVVAHGDGGATYAIVLFDSDTISGIDLLRKSGVDLVTVDFGGLGSAVCSIEGEGCGVESCRTRLCQTSDPDSPYWRYFQFDAEAGWSAVPTGASSRELHHEDIDGWSWSANDPGLPDMSIDDIAVRAGFDEASAEEAFVTTYDANGAIVQRSTETQSMITYAIAGIVILVLVAVLYGQGAMRKRNSSVQEE